MGGCSGTPGPAAAHTSAAASPLRTASEPGCTTATATAPTLTRVATLTTPTPDAPFGVVTTPDGKWSFVATAKAVSVLSDGGSGSGSAAQPRLVRNVALPATVDAGAAGETLTPDGLQLLVASGQGAYVLSVAALEDGSADPVLGELSNGGTAVTARACLRSSAGSARGV